jgi:hypothetical protein
LLFITFWTLCKRLAASGARKPKMSKANDMKTLYSYELTCFYLWLLCEIHDKDGYLYYDFDWMR